MYFLELWPLWNPCFSVTDKDQVPTKSVSSQKRKKKRRSRCSEAYNPPRYLTITIYRHAFVYNCLHLHVGIQDSVSIRNYLGFRLVRHFLQKLIKVGGVPLGVPARFIQRRQLLLLLIVLCKYG